jgi:hypothetical protein
MRINGIDCHCRPVADGALHKLYTGYAPTRNTKIACILRAAYYNRASNQQLESDMDEDAYLQVGSLVQLNPETCRNRMFAGCIMTVTEPKTWGAQGYVQALGTDEAPGGMAYYRAKWDEMEVTGGTAPFVAA